MDENGVEALKRKLDDAMRRQKNDQQIGGVLISAMRKAAKVIDPEQRRSFSVGRILENPEMIASLARVVLDAGSSKFWTSLKVPHYSWRKYLKENEGDLVDGSRRSYWRYDLGMSTNAPRVTRGKHVRLTLICAMEEVTAEQAIALIRQAGLQPAHPVQGFECAKRFPGLYGTGPVTILGRTLRLRRWPRQKGMSREQIAQRAGRPRPSYYLTIWGKPDGLTTYFEEVSGRIYPAYSLFLATQVLGA